jgi:hypothetical protein
MLNHNRAIERLGAYNRGYASDHTFVRAMTGAGERQGCCYRRNGIRRVVLALVEQIGRRIDEEGIRRDDSMRAPSLAKVARFIETAFREQQAAQMQAHDPDESSKARARAELANGKMGSDRVLQQHRRATIHFPSPLR